MTRLRLHILLLLLLGASFLAIPRAVDVARADVAAPAWTSGGQADLETPERPTHHHAPLLRRARRMSGAGVLEIAHVPPVATAPAPEGGFRYETGPSVRAARVAPEPLRPYISTLPPPTRS